ncbi:ATP-dependent metalloprotease [bacterium DOLZORAL124_38_8]|nr:MAG: ATP-dependent metalloprotease [bacterium DOLZORAL124_38_8]
MKKPKPRNFKKTNPFLILFLVAVIGAGISLLSGGLTMLGVIPESPKKVDLATFLTEYKQDHLKEVIVSDEKVTGVLKDTKKSRIFAVKEAGVNAVDLEFMKEPVQAKITIDDSVSGHEVFEMFLSFLPLLLILGIFFFLTRKMSGAGGEGGPFGFGKTKARIFDVKSAKTKFSDVAGAEEAKEEVMELVDFLKNPKKYQKMGAKIPKGILMVGPPGTGKTLLARAIAGEAKVPFFSVSGSEFVEMFVGVGASRVRDLFKTAKQNAPAIIFMDEIDAIGKKRGKGSGGGHDEREQTLNQILTEMDGFEEGHTVIVIAATNRPETLDKALLRPGRFDRRVHIDLPDMNARKQILEVHARNKKMEDGVDLATIASKTVGFSGADIENVLNEAAILAVKNRKEKIEQADLHAAVEKVAIGPERKSRKFTEKERKMTSYHEVGHALAGHFCEYHDPVHKISIVSRGRTLGVTWFLPEEDVYSKTKQQLFDEMVSLQGGRMAEKLIFGEEQLTTGASNDLERISAIARSMVMRYGMGSDTVGPVVFVSENEFQKPYSEETARLIDLEVKKLIDESEKIAFETLKKHKKLLIKISEDLLEKENITKEEFLSYFEEK